VDCIFENTTVVQPDLVFVETARQPVMSERRIEGPPTLVVEVLSASSAGIDRRRKRQLYARYAVPYYWIVDPAVRTIEAYQLTHGAYRDAGTMSETSTVSLPPFPDLILAPRDVWIEQRETRQ
jgi:Uma2 family endonuclease